VSDTQLMVAPVERAEKSDPGRDPTKQVNEDACQYEETPFGHLCVLCDGMGGHEGGREASTAAVEAIVRHFHAAELRPDVPAPARAREVLEEAIVLANHDVFALGPKHGATRPGSTVVAILMHGLGTEVAHVGDSRCYLIHGDQITQVTRDHSIVQQMVDVGILTPEQAAGHPDANKITRALGTREDVEVELRPSAIVHEAGDTFVLCSDGLSDLVQPSDIQRIASSLPASEAVDQLVDLANARGGHDNVTVMLLRARESAPVPRDVGAVPRDVGAVTEAMPAVAPVGVAPVGIAPRPPGPPRLRRRASPAVVAGVALAVVGVVAAVTVIVIGAAPHNGNSEVPSFATPIVPYAERPSAAMVPLGIAHGREPAGPLDGAPPAKATRRR
jgi:PPM family protein phosphatase